MDTRDGQRAEPGNWLPAVGGVLLTVYGLRRGSWTGMALAAAGGGLVYLGLRSADRLPRRGDLVRQMLDRYGAGVNAGTRDALAQAVKEERHPAGTYIEDVVAEASDDSFPASDPPAWTARG